MLTGPKPQATKADSDGNSNRLSSNPRDIQSKLMEWFQEHPGLHVRNSRLSREFPEEHELGPQRISGALSSLARAGYIERVSRGVYVYNGPKALMLDEEGRYLVGELVEVIGKDHAGTLIGRSTDGELFKVTPL